MSRCSKCGSADTFKAYHSTWIDCQRSCCYSSSTDEHLHYFCRTCEWDWTGETFDKRGLAEKNEAYTAAMLARRDK